MKKFAFPLTGLSLVACLVAFAVAVHPAPDAICWEGECDCGPDQYTSTVTKAAADCLWTAVAISNAVRPEITCQTECLDVFEWVSSCHQISPGLWQGSGRIHYQCGTCEI